MSEVRRGPLSGLRIIEIGHMLAGPYCGMLLADLGAEVIKIEAPGGGDIGRTVGPHFVGPHNTYFASLNRSKKSVVIDLASAEGRAALEELVCGADGLLTNLRPSAIKKLGLTYEALSAVNPRIACLALTGYGLDGPYSDRPAYDYVIQALVGIMALTGNPGGPPVKTGYSVVDNSAGVTGALGLVSMIHQGHGGQIDVSLYDVMLSQMNYLASAYLNGDERPERQIDGAHPYIVPAQLFETADGHLALFVSHDEFWRRLATEAGKPQWLDDPRFSTMKARAANRALVVREVADLLRLDTTGHWVDRLSPLGLVVAGVETLDAALESDLVRERDMVVDIPLAEGRMRLVGSPIRIIGQEPIYGPPPQLGEHGDGSHIPPRPEPERETAPASRRAFSRALSRIADASVREVLASTEAAAAAPAWRIGVTGAPGSGKSSLIARLAAVRLARMSGDAVGEKLAILAIDPSSPIRHGAILGDRVRMDAIADEPRVYVRSLASRGGRDGLAHNIVDLLALADGHGFEEILLETVGVGQSEHAVRALVDSLVLVLHPEAGDSIQAMKSGIMEMADVYVVNKADLPGAERTAAELKAVLKAAHRPMRPGWTPPVIEIARGRPEGVAELDRALEAHRAHLEELRRAEEVSLARRRYHLQSLVQRRVDEVLAADSRLLDHPDPRTRYDRLLAALRRDAHADAGDGAPRPGAEVT